MQSILPIVLPRPPLLWLPTLFPTSCWIAPPRRLTLNQSGRRLFLRLLATAFKVSNPRIRDLNRFDPPHSAPPRFTLLNIHRSLCWITAVTGRTRTRTPAPLRKRLVSFSGWKSSRNERTPVFLFCSRASSTNRFSSIRPRTPLSRELSLTS